jgi:GH24 family phage-related lysozyme (muramidase)
VLRHRAIFIDLRPKSFCYTERHRRLLSAFGQAPGRWYVAGAILLEDSMITTPSAEQLLRTAKEEGGFISHCYRNIINGVPDADTAGAGHVLRAGDSVPCQPPYFPYGSAEWRAHAASCPGIPDATMQTWMGKDMAGEAAAVAALSRKCSLVFTQNIFDALTDLAYNEGPAICLDPVQSHMAAALVASDVLAAARHLLDWDRTPAGPSAELLGRRWREVAVFLTADGAPIMSLAAASRLVGVPLPA